MTLDEAADKWNGQTQDKRIANRWIGLESQLLELRSIRYKAVLRHKDELADIDSRTKVLTRALEKVEG